MKPYTIGVTGGSGSGKTFFLQALSAHFKPSEICLISQDNYYFPIERQLVDENGIHNFDLPTSIDRKRYLDDLLKLKSGQSITLQEYTFNNPAVQPKQVQLHSAPIIVTEGLFVQYYEEIAQELDLKIFIEAGDEVRLNRRIVRDQVERSYGADAVRYQDYYHAAPIYKSLIEPLKQYADFVIPNNSNFERALDVLKIFLETRLP